MSRLYVVRRRLHKHRGTAVGGGGGGGITHGEQINGTNTGPRVATSPSGVPGGMYTLDQSFLNTYNGGSSTFSAKSFSGVNFNSMTAGLAVTFDDCLLSNGNFELAAVSNNGLLSFNYCRMVGTADPYNNPTDYSWSNYTFLNGHHIRLNRCDIEGFGVGMLNVGDDFQVTECYVHDCAPYQSEANGGPVGGTHHGCITIQFNSCTDVVIERSKLKAVRGTPAGSNSSGISACLTFYNDSYHAGPTTVRDNWFDGTGSYASYWGATDKPAAYAANKTVTGNKFGRSYNRYCGGSWPVVSGDFSGAGETWSNNTWGPLGVAPESDPAEGSLIAAPTPTP